MRLFVEVLVVTPTYEKLLRTKTIINVDDISTVEPIEISGSQFTQVCLRSGSKQSLIVGMPYDEFKKLLLV